MAGWVRGMVGVYGEDCAMYFLVYECDEKTRVSIDVSGGYQYVWLTEAPLC
jgi:hypothetical protein